MDKCAECLRLWRVYANATADHVKLELKLRDVAVAQPWESAVRRLSLAVEAAYRLREQALDSIRTHEELAHSGSGAASG